MWLQFVLLLSAAAGSGGEVWWSPWSHPDTILGEPFARLPSVRVFFDNYYVRVLSNRLDPAAGPVTEDDVTTARAAVDRMAAVLILEDLNPWLFL